MPKFPHPYEPYKEKYSALAPEELQLDTMYAFTINPIQQFDGKENRLKLSYQYIRDVLVELQFCDTQMYVEISKQGRLHAHGYIQIHDILKFYLYTIPKLQTLCTYKIDTMDDQLIWEEYIHKSQHLFKPALAKYNYPILIDTEDIRNFKQRNNIIDLKLLV